MEKYPPFGHPVSSMGRTQYARLLMAAGSWCIAVLVSSAVRKRDTTSGSTAWGHAYASMPMALHAARESELALENCSTHKLMVQALNQRTASHL